MGVFHNMNKKIPQDKILDGSLCLLLEGYPFIQNRCHKYKSDIFQTRLFGKKAICMTGKEASKLFYDNHYFVRKGVAPKRVQKTLTGEKGVQGLDVNEHKNRKLMFMSIMTPENIETLKGYTEKLWRINSKKWTCCEIVLFDEVQKLLCQVACKWAGIPLYQNEINQRATDLGKMIDGFGAVGLRYWEGVCARNRSEEWIKSIIEKIRNDELSPKESTASYAIAWHLDADNQLLNTHVAAVELLNIIRPIVAIATYITFGTLALYTYPDCHKKLQLKDAEYLHQFVQEVRRFYPFTPYIAAKAKRSFIWNQYFIKKDTLCLLDIYGSLHDPELWSNPYSFMPERFHSKVDNNYSFIPQGGGDYYKGHRCAGELVTITIMEISLDFIANHLTYSIPYQNLAYPLSRIPTLPKSRFAMNKVQTK